MPEKFIVGLTRNDGVAVEAHGNSTHFHRAVKPHVARVAVIAPGQFEVIRQWVKNADSPDGSLIAFFLSRGMLPEAMVRSNEHVELMSLAATRDRLVCARASLICNMHGMFVRNGEKVRRAAHTSNDGFTEEVEAREQRLIESIELEAIRTMISSLNHDIEKLAWAMRDCAKILPRYECIVSIRGIGPLSAGFILSQVGDIEDFREPGKRASCFAAIPGVSNSNQANSVGRIAKRGNKLARKPSSNVRWSLRDSTHTS